ncbi:ubiquinol-cytochrome C chaperone family protein [Desulfonatronum thiodismutans]|uniref:ubiquinol-cytochrome C chaperone family protein n=1 Tax=Desulfonatronum thiodismutans TaxID=159290 RepID=UPI00069044EB|nr:ubiquinol-cytochrome C chaperone family protein [Desulfonatronum thiodismutans]
MATDPHLTELFGACSDEDLIPIRDYILKARTNGLIFDERYKKQPNFPTRYIESLVYQIRTFGGNSFVNVCRGVRTIGRNSFAEVYRGDGVEYAEIVHDVAKKFKVHKVPGFANKTVEEREQLVLAKILEKSMKKMTEDELRELEELFGEAGLKGRNLRGGIPLAALIAQGAIRFAGLAAHNMAAIVANAVARQILGNGFRIAANAALNRGMAVFVGPIGIGITAILTLVNIAGPAYRVTIPVVCHVAYLRAKAEFAESV